MLVFDINHDTVEDLYSAQSLLPIRILFKIMPRSILTKKGWSHCRMRSSSSVSEVYTLNIGMFPGWESYMRIPAMHYIARYARLASLSLLSKGVDNSAVFLSPLYLPLRNIIKPSFSIYHAVDNHSLYRPNQAHHIRRMEAAMIRESDITICSSEDLRQKLSADFPEKRSDIYRIHNPVPEEFISESPPKNIKPIPGRKFTIGYTGSVDGRADIKSIMDLARKLPHHEIVIFTNENVSKLFIECANIRIKRQTDRRQIPDAIRKFDICIIPLCKNDFNAAASAGKLYEYLGSGKPIVTLNCPEADLLVPQIISTHNSNDFIKAVETLVVNGEPPSAPELRIASARKRTPSCQADLLAEIIKKTRAAR